MPLPQAIDHHPRGERVVGAGHPLGKPYPEFFVVAEFVDARRGRVMAADDSAQESGPHHFAKTVELTANADERHRQMRNMGEIVLSRVRDDVGFREIAIDTAPRGSLLEYSVERRIDDIVAQPLEGLSLFGGEPVDGARRWLPGPFRF